MNEKEIIYSEDDIRQLSTTLQWQGSGTEHDPLIIPNKTGLPEKFKISSNELYIKIIDCSFDYVILEKCRCISIERCTFNHLGLVISSNISLKNSSLSSLHLSFSYYNHFDHCTISKISILSSKKNEFQDCTLDAKARKNLKRDIFDPSSLSKPLLVGSIASMLMIIMFISYYLINTIPLDVNLLITISIFGSFSIFFLIMRNYLKKNSEPESSKSREY